MANHKSAIKKIRQDEERRLRNRAYKTRLRTAIKKLESELSAENTDVAQTMFQEVSSIIDRTASKGIIHKNTAARKKSRLSKRVNALIASA